MGQREGEDLDDTLNKQRKGCLISAVTSHDSVVCQARETREFFSDKGAVPGFQKKELMRVVRSSRMFHPRSQYEARS